MSKKITLNLFVGLSLFFGVSLAEQAPNAGFMRVSRDEYPAEKNKVEIPNMPKFRSQGMVGMCTAFAAAAALDYCYIVENKLKSSEVGDDQRFSTLELYSFEVETSKADMFFLDPHLIIQKAIKNGSLANEASAPMDLIHKRIKIRSLEDLRKISSKKLSPQVKFERMTEAELAKWLADSSQEVAWFEFKRTWDLFKKINRDDEAQFKSFISTRVTGEFGLMDNFNLTESPERLLDALAQESFPKCLTALFFPPDASFTGINLPAGLRLEVYPLEGKMSNYAETLKIVRQRIVENIPVVVTDYCVDDKSIKAMSKGRDEMHTFLITGYKELHNSKSFRALVKIHNSWGAEWQNDKNNDGGWMDAESLFDRTLYDSETLGWVVIPNHQSVAPKDDEPIIFRIPENWKLAKRENSRNAESHSLHAKFTFCPKRQMLNFC